MESSSQQQRSPLKASLSINSSGSVQKDGLAFKSSMAHHHLHSSPTIDLLVVDNDDTAKPELVRGLSIKLSRPPEDLVSEESSKDSKDEAGPKYYYSLSHLSLTSSGSFSNSDTELKVPGDKVNSIMQQGVPLHRTESRLPSLETLLGDDELRKNLFDSDDTVLTRDLVMSLRLRTTYDKYRALSELTKKSTRDDSYKLASVAKSSEKERIVDSLVLLVKQELAKHVDHMRFLVDQKAEGQFDQAQFDMLLVNPEIQIAIHPWALISTCLRMLRNFCVDEQIQNTIHSHRLADLLMVKKRLFFVAIGQAHSYSLSDVAFSDRALIDEVKNSLPRTTMTFLANLLTQNLAIQRHLWNILWPSGYWLFLLLSGPDHFDHFCVLLHNHIAPLTEPGKSTVEALEGSADAEDLTTSLGMNRVHWIVNAMEWLKQREERTPENEEAISTFINFMRLLLAINVLLRREKSSRFTPMSRRTATDFSLEEWFPLIILKIVCLNRGRGFARLCNGLLDLETKCTATKSDTTDLLTSLNPPADVLQIVSSTPFGSMLYPLTFASSMFPTPIECLAHLLDLCRNLSSESTHFMDNESPTGRKWRAITRSFLNRSNCVFVAELFRASLTALTTGAAAQGYGLPNVKKCLKEEIKEVITTDLVLKQDSVVMEESGAKEVPQAELHVLSAQCTGPALRMLSVMADSSETSKVFDERFAIPLCKLAVNLLNDAMPLMEAHVKLTKEQRAAEVPNVVLMPQYPAAASSSFEKKKSSTGRNSSGSFSQPSNYGHLMNHVTGKELFLFLASLGSRRPYVIEHMKANGIDNLCASYSIVNPDDPGCQEAVTVLTRILNLGF